MPSIVGIASLKGGVGKTTSALHLAHYLSQYGKVLVLDDDSNRTARLWSNKALAENRKWPFPVVSTKAAASLGGQFDYILIDCAGGQSDAELNELVESVQFLVIPTAPALMDLVVMQDTLTKAARYKGRPATEFCRILLNLVPPPPAADGSQARDLLKAQGLPVFTAEITNRAALRRAPALGGVASELAADKVAGAKEAAAQYAAIGQELRAWITAAAKTTPQSA